MERVASFTHALASVATVEEDKTVSLMDRSSIASSVKPSSLSLPSEPELSQYRAISPWAVATLLVGLVSPLALVGPLLWWVPLVAIPLALLAARQLQQSDPLYVGRKAAIAGACLAALFFSWSVTQRISREVRINSEARQFADDLLKLILDGKLREAHQIQSAAARRQSPGSDLAAYYQAQADAKKDLEAFQKIDAVAAIAGKASDFEFAPGVVTRHTNDGPGDYFQLRYELVRGEFPTGTSTLWIAAKREHRPDSGTSEWQINSISLTEPTN